MMFDHHYPFLSDYYAIVLGFSIVILVFLMLFIQYLRIGLNSEESVIIDSTANAYASNEKALDGQHHH